MKYTSFLTASAFTTLASSMSFALICADLLLTWPQLLLLRLVTLLRLAELRQSTMLSTSVPHHRRLTVTRLL
jgi:hypothetical protein